MFQILQHPEIEKKILEEIDKVCGKDGEITFENVKNLSYLEACLYESLRLHPSVPVMIRTCIKDTKMPSGFVVQKGQVLIFAIA